MAAALKKELEKVNKTAARRLFNEGKILYLVPCKVYPNFGNCFITPYEIQKDRVKDGIVNFDRIVDNFEYYNCNNEVGRYTHYYVEVKSLEEVK
jgi:hypothetical protein